MKTLIYFQSIPMRALQLLTNIIFDIDVSKNNVLSLNCAQSRLRKWQERATNVFAMNKVPFVALEVSFYFLNIITLYSY